jgi:glycosyltransferase involved in cell wall biosynthesis
MSNPPGVLFVLPWSLSTAGGVNQVVINLARETNRRGHFRPIIFCVDPSQDTFHTTETEGVTLISGRLAATGRAGRNPVSAMRKLGPDIRTWRSFLKDQEIRVVNPHLPGLNCLIFALLRRFTPDNIRLLFSLHGAEASGFSQLGMTGRTTYRWMLKQADQVVCCSEDLAARALELFKLDEQRLRSIHNGIDIAELEHGKREGFRPAIGDFDSYLLNVATFDHSKGQDLLMKAYTTLLREGLKSALVMIGRNTTYLQNLRSLARQLGLQDHVFFIPDLEHRHTLGAIRHARLLVQPSREEPFGITLLEAGYLGTPIVATRTGGIPEVVGGYYPYLTEPDDSAALARTIDEALFNPTETKRQIKLMKRRVSSTFTWGTAYSAYESLWSPDAD